MTAIAALYVAPPGVGSYHNIEGVDPWWLACSDDDDSEIQPTLAGFEMFGGRDARLYDGPHPVVAHPPCKRWCRLAGFTEAIWGLKRGDDGGCFAAALASVRKWGGVLEHPAYSSAWRHFGISTPPTGGQWVSAGDCGGWTCYVEQGRYGHPAKKATWLYAHGIDLPQMRWGHTHDANVDSGYSWCGNKTNGGGENRPRLSAAQRDATPIDFRDALLSMARTARSRR